MVVATIVVVCGFEGVLHVQVAVHMKSDSLLQAPLALRSQSVSLFPPLLLSARLFTSSGSGIGNEDTYLRNSGRELCSSASKRRKTSSRYFGGRDFSSARRAGRSTSRPSRDIARESMT